MVIKFTGFQPNHNRALQIWLILISKAANRQTIRFGELAEMVGYDAAPPLVAPLNHIGFYCRQNDLPPLTVLVSNQVTGLPGEGWNQIHPGADPNAARERVFGYDWFGIFPPTPQVLADAYQAGQNP